MKTTLTDGSPVTTEHLEIDKSTGMQRGYVVLSEEERSKGFVRPVRKSYKHVGKTICGKSHAETLGGGEFVCRLHINHEGECGNFLETTRDIAERAVKLHLLGGCGTVTTMGMAIAETYARNPYFYGGTFCCGCGAHFPVGLDGEFVWDGTTEKVGT